MNILCIHQNYPGQFKFLAPALAAGGHRVTAMTMQPVEPRSVHGVRIAPYAAARGTTAQVHPWVSDFETKVIRGEACFRAALKLRAEGLQPEVIVAHPGWGESLFLKEVWPQARLGIYCEYYYLLEGGDVGFDPEFPVEDVGEVCRLQMKNVNNLLHFSLADAGISPTRWQASTFPEPFRSKITVVHDGIDTVAVTPAPAVRVRLNDRIILTRQDEVITFVNRNLEPCRGCHVFLRALPELLARRPRAQVLIVGGDSVSYGKKSADGRSWKDVYLDEVRDRIAPADWQRVHFLGRVPYREFIALLQLSSVHVYLTYPFVLSWSLLEAMSAGCAIVASDTAPVREVISDDVTGRLVGFFDGDALVRTVCTLLDDPAGRARLGQAAREAACAAYDLRSVCLPRQLEWVRALAG